MQNDMADSNVCSSRKHPHSPIEGIGNSREGGGVSTAQKFKAIDEAKLEFPEGWG